MARKVTPQTIGPELGRIRNALGIPMSRIPMAKGAISNLEHGERVPMLSTIDTLCRAYNISFVVTPLGWYLLEDGESLPPKKKPGPDA